MYLLWTAPGVPTFCILKYRGLRREKKHCSLEEYWKLLATRG